MAITCSLLTADKQISTVASFNTVSISPTANRPVAIIVATHTSGPIPNNMTVSGAGLTWTHKANESNGVTNISIQLAIGVGASPSSGALTVDFAAQDQTIEHWFVVDLAGADGTGTAVQVVTGVDASTTTPALTLASFGSATNGVLAGIYVYNQAVTAVTPGTGFTELSEQADVSARRSQCEWRADQDTSVDWTFDNADATRKVAFEIKELVAATPKSPLPPVIPTAAVQQASNW